MKSKDTVRRPPRRPAILLALAAAGAKGLLSVQVAAAAQMAANNASSLLADMEEAGQVGGWLDPFGPQLKRRRWWLREYLPPRQPAPTGEPLTLTKPPRVGVSKSAQWRRKAAGLQPLTVQTEGLGLRHFGPAAGKGGDVQLPQLAPPVPQPGPVPVQRCAGWTHDPRYQVPPGAKVKGAGFAAAGVGRDALTGKAWGAR
jgi:hypothetical protein